MSTTQPVLDSTTERVIDMYSQYPYPLASTHRDMFKDLVYPFIKGLGNVKSILEAGCGTGNIAIVMAQLLPEVRIVGIDLTEESLRIAREAAAKLNLKNIEFRCSNLLIHEPELGTFDFVHCQGVIHHLSDSKRGLENLYKYLNPGRYAYIWMYMLLGRRWILEIQEILDLLGIADMSYEQRIDWTKRVEAMYHKKKKREGLKRHHDQKKKPSIAAKSEKRLLNSRVLSLMEHTIHILNKKGWKALTRTVIRKLFRKSEMADIKPEPTDIDVELEERRYKTGLVDTYLHPHAIFYRMEEVLNLFAETGFSDVRISDGMSTSLQQFFDGDFPDLEQVVANLPIEEQYQFLELVEKPSGVGFFVRKPE